jgi:hypothetical protein
MLEEPHVFSKVQKTKGFRIDLGDILSVTLALISLIDALQRWTESPAWSKEEAVCVLVQNLKKSVAFLLSLDLHLIWHPLLAHSKTASMPW